MLADGARQMKGSTHTAVDGGAHRPAVARIVQVQGHNDVVEVFDRLGGRRIRKVARAPREAACGSLAASVYDGVRHLASSRASDATVDDASANKLADVVDGPLRTRSL